MRKPSWTNTDLAIFLKHLLYYFSITEQADICLILFQSIIQNSLYFIGRICVFICDFVSMYSVQLFIFSYSFLQYIKYSVLYNLCPTS